MLMILLYITGYGWTAIGFIALSVLLAIKILKRGNRNARPGCLGIGYVALVAFCLLSLSATLGGVLGGFVVNAFTLPRYEAKVTSLSSYQSTSQDKDSRGRSSSRTVTMYTSTVAFTTNDGTPVEIETDVSSSGKRAIGETVTIGYKPGMEKAQELNGTKYLLMGGATVMLLIMAYVVIGGFLYAMGFRMVRFYRLGMGLLLYFILPLAMLFLLGAMGYAVVLYFMGDKPDMPVWAVVVCIFFCLILSGALLGYVRMLSERRRGIS